MSLLNIENPGDKHNQKNVQLTDIVMSEIDIKEKFKQLLNGWVTKRRDPKWENVIAALRCIGLHNLADELADELAGELKPHQSQNGFEVEEPATTQDIGCEKRVKYENKDVQEAFSLLIDEILVVCNKESFLKLKRNCFRYVKLFANESFSANLKKTNDLDNLINELYDLPYCMLNWIDIRILEKMSFGVHLAVEEIKKYKEGIKLRDLVVEDIKSDKSINHDHFIKIKEKWKRKVTDIKIQNLWEHWDYIEAKLTVKSHLLLSCITARERWVEIDWLLFRDSGLVDRAIDSATNSNHNGLLNAEVFYLIIGDYIIRDLSPDHYTGNSEGVVLKQSILDNMNYQYIIFLNDLRKILEDKCDRISQVLSLFQSSDKHNISMFLNGTELKDLYYEPMSTAMDVLFQTICTNWKFFDYGMIDAVVETSESTRAKQLVLNYTERINEALKKYDLNSIYNTIQEKIYKRQNASILKIKCEVEKVYFEEWKSIKAALHKCFSVPEGTFQFDSTIPGCITLIYKSSLQAKNHLLEIKITNCQLKPLATMKITSLIIDDEVELKVPFECNTEDVVSWTKCSKVTTVPIKETASEGSKCTLEPKKLNAAYVMLLHQLKMEIKKNKQYISDMKFGLRTADKHKENYFSSIDLLSTEKTIDELFFWIGRDCKYFTYTILKAAIDASGCKKAIKLIDNYIEKVKNIVINSLDLNSENKKVQIGKNKYEENTKRFTVICKKDTLLIEELNLIVKSLEECLKLSPASVLVKEVIHNNCFTLVCRIPLKVQLPPKPCAHELKKLSEKEIESLIIDDDKMELKIPSNCDTEDKILWTEYIEVTTDPVEVATSTKSDSRVDIPPKTNMLIPELEESYDVEANVEMIPLNENTDSVSAQVVAKEKEELDVEVKSPVSVEAVNKNLSTPAQETSVLKHRQCMVLSSFETEPIELLQEYASYYNSHRPHSFGFNSSTSIPVAA